MKSTVITIDVDWASDDVIEFVFNYLVEMNVKSTWFITHDFPKLDEMKKKPELFEIGLHPNFLKNSTHGKTEEEILSFVKNIYPAARVIRMHGMYQYGGLLSKIIAQTGINVDSSIFLPEMAGIKVLDHLTPNGLLKRIPIFWADDYELLKEQSDWNPSKYFEMAGIKVFLFHPIHLALNTKTYEDYLNWKSNPKINFIKDDDHGAMSFFHKLLQWQSKTNQHKFLTECI